MGQSVHVDGSSSPSIRPVLRALIEHFFPPGTAGQGQTIDRRPLLVSDSEPVVVELVHGEIVRRRKVGETVSAVPWLAGYPEDRELLDLLFSGAEDSSFEQQSTVVVRRQRREGSLGQRGDATADAAAPAPIRMGRYELQRALGQGGFGVVWLARDPALQRFVAIKTTRPDKVWPPEIVNDFLAEGRRLAQLRHPGIVSVFDVGLENGQVFIVSEYIDGGTLEQWISRAPENSTEHHAQAVEIVAALADALHVAHSTGIVHRDIKPANVLLDRHGRPHLADFGMAASEQEQLEESASTLGTFAYMSPEQLRGDSHLADGRSDIYSLGVLLYRMLTGKLPFQARGLAQYREAVLSREPRPPRSLVPEIDPALERVCLKCLAKLPQDRYTTVIDLAGALRTTPAEPPAPPAAQAATVAAPVSPTPRTGIGGRIAVAAALPVVLLIAAALYFRPFFPASAPPPAADPPANQAAAPTPAQANPAAPADPQLRVTAPRAVSDPAEIAEWSLSEDGQTLKMISSAFLPLELGTVDQDLDLELQVVQPQWEGRFGLFFGYGLSADRTEMQFQTLRFERLSTGNLRISWGAFYWKPASPSALSSEMYSAHEFPVPPPAAKTLAVHIRRGRLTAVEFDGQPLIELVDDYHRRPLVRGGVKGPFGIWCLQSNVVVTALRLNARPTKFNVR